MKKSIYLSALAMLVVSVAELLLCTAAIAQNDANYQWAKNIGGTFDDYGYSIAVDASGNVYITGFFNGAVDFDPGAGKILMNYFRIFDNG